MERYGVGQSVTRREDPKLVQGAGRFVDDQTRPDLAYGHVVRSGVAHADIVGLDIADAVATKGVLAVITVADLRRDGVTDVIPCLAQPPGGRLLNIVTHGQPVLASDRVRYVGDPIAFVVAETPDAARDGAEQVVVDYGPLPAEIDCRVAAEPGATQLWPDAPNNRCFDWEQGDADAVEAAFATAASQVDIDLVNNRIVQNAMETRNAIGEWEADGERYVLTTGTQFPHAMKAGLATHLFNVGPSRVRILVDDVGGGFGGKNSIYPEQVLVLYAARRLGRPVKWVSERTEAFVSDFHGRDNLTWAALALDADGRVLALKVHTHANIGAYAAPRGPVSPVNGVIVASSCYRVPAIHVAVDAVYTNTVPTDPYRGAGRPEVIYMLERLMDLAADHLGLDRVEFRRRNLIPQDAFPYTTPTGLTYDDADFEALLATALVKTDWAGFEQRRASAQAAGRLRGIGMANYLERCGGGRGLGESARLEMDEDGRARLFIGSMANGQGHQTAFAQIVHEVLGLPPEDIEIIQGDTDQIETGTGTGGSWSIPLGSGAIVKAGARLIDRAREIAASALEAAAVDLSFEDGAFRVAGTDLVIGLADVARRAVAEDGERLSGQDRFEPDNYTFPYGCHIAEVEIDPETGTIALLRYDAVHDFGRALNPALLGGQVHGGVVQGIGQALLEHTVYDRDGQLLAGSFLDYGLPRAGDLPDIDFHHQVSPTTRNPYGIKGCGEAGATGSPPAVMNAVIDALKPCGVRHVDMPATPERVWQAIRAAAGATP